MNPSSLAHLPQKHPVLTAAVLTYITAPLAGVMYQLPSVDQPCHYPSLYMASGCLAVTGTATFLKGAWGLFQARGNIVQKMEAMAATGRAPAHPYRAAPESSLASTSWSPEAKAAFGILLSGIIGSVVGSFGFLESQRHLSMPGDIAHPEYDFCRGKRNCK